MEECEGIEDPFHKTGLVTNIILLDGLTRNKAPYYFPLLTSPGDFLEDLNNQLSDKLHKDLHKALSGYEITWETLIEIDTKQLDEMNFEKEEAKVLMQYLERLKLASTLSEYTIEELELMKEEIEQIYLQKKEKQESSKTQEPSERRRK